MIERYRLTSFKGATMMQVEVSDRDYAVAMLKASLESGARQVEIELIETNRGHVMDTKGPSM